MPTSPALIEQFEALLAPIYPADKPGAAVIVVKDGETIFRKSYGMANLELGVPIEPQMVFRLGSITKQFTAVSILMLYERGKLDLQDDLTRFLPDYPTGGRKITVEHLLTHTSGIKSYTGMPEWFPLWRKDMSLDELITLFKDQPFDFEPGEEFRYNNSGYILLGAIIEKISGIKYADFIQENIFTPLGMSHSLYDVTEKIIPGRVSGYSRAKDGYVNAPYLSMSQPYAAGSLASSVDDLALWDAALYTDKLLKPETLALAFQSYKLKNGNETGYGYGWMISSYEGSPTIEHGGGINGFTTGAIRFPAEKVYAAVLTNCENPETPPDTAAFKLAALAIGKPFSLPPAIEVPEDTLKGYVGVYQINPQEERIITFQDGKLYSQRSGGMRIDLVPYAPDAFLFNKVDDRLLFERDETGKISGMRVFRRLGPPELCPLTDKPLPAERPAVELAPALLQRFLGQYELAPGFALEVILTDGELFLQAPGEDKLPLFAESETCIFARQVALSLTYQFDASGSVTECTFQQGPQKMPLKKIG
jgi:CubicO group peptidase (beta-lactamase class C family)